MAAEAESTQAASMSCSNFTAIQVGGRTYRPGNPLPGAPLRFRLRFGATLCLIHGAGSGLPSAVLFGLWFCFDSGVAIVGRAGNKYRSRWEVHDPWLQIVRRKDLKNPAVFQLETWVPGVMVTLNRDTHNSVTA